MKYMLLIYGDENSEALNEAAKTHCYMESTLLADDLRSKGRLLGCAPLQPTASATSVRIRDGKRTVTDGPFAETKEQLGGYFLVEASDLDEAIGIADRIPGSRWGTVEIRPVVDLQGLRAN